MIFISLRVIIGGAIFRHYVPSEEKLKILAIFKVILTAHRVQQNSFLKEFCLLEPDADI